MRSRLLATFVVLANLTTWASQAAAQFGFPDDFVKHYRFLPRLSVIAKTGGFAGVDDRYFVRGTFDLSVTQSPLAIFPPIFGAQFENVNAWGVHPVRDDVVDVDQALNLSGVAGSTVYRGPRNIFQFRGTTEDGSSVRLWAAVLGRWFYLRGGTMAPPDSADFFEYHIRAVARERPVADLNDDGVVDAADLSALRNDPTGPGDTFLAWQRQLGETSPSLDELDAALDDAIANLDDAAGAVPEPSSAIMALAAGAAVCVRRRRTQPPVA